MWNDKSLSAFLESFIESEKGENWADRSIGFNAVPALDYRAGNRNTSGGQPIAVMQAIQNWLGN